MDLRGLSYASGNYGLAGRQAASVDQPCRLCCPIPSTCLQRLKGSDDVSGQQLHTTDEPHKGFRERLAVEPTDAKQAGEFVEEDVRTLWVSVDEHGQRWKAWKQVCREIQSHSVDDGWSEYHEGPNCTLDVFLNWGRNGSDPMTWLSHIFEGNST